MSITSQAKQEAVVNAIKEHEKQEEGDRRYWIGGFRLGKYERDEDFYWLTGERVNKYDENWKVREPSYVENSELEKYMMIYGGNEKTKAGEVIDYQWNDESISVEFYAFIYEPAF